MIYKKVHLVGVCGVAMGSLAQMFVEYGYSVTGSDSNIYPPMSTILKKSGVTVYNTFSERNLGGCDLVIIGNAISRGNCEVEYVLNNKLSYMSMAHALHTFFLQDKQIIAVAGTHGKTTTSALLAHILTQAGQQPFFFVGGVLKNYDTNYGIGDGRFAVVEADEYDSAFFEKVPKFMFYKPDQLVITSLEFDHADIYTSLEEIELWFKRLVNIIPGKGTILYANDYSNIENLVQSGFSCSMSFGENGADIGFTCKGTKDHYALLDISTNTDCIEIETPQLGRFNYMNITAAVGMALNLGIDRKAIQRAVKSFLGVKRRQELIFNSEPVKIYEDFAHHPTAIRYAVEAFRERYPQSVLWVLYEPRSATSRRNVFQEVLPGVFSCADQVIIKTPYSYNRINEDERLDAEKLVNDINELNSNGLLFERVEDIVTSVTKRISYDKENVLLILSNGSFDGIYDKLIEAFFVVQKESVW